MRTQPLPRDAFAHVFDTPLGAAACVYKEKPFRLFALYLPRPKKDLDKILAGVTGKSHPQAQKTARLALEFLKGKTASVPWELLDYGPLTGLQKEVLAACARIPKGQVASYGELAEQVGRPGAARFVGTVMAQNPFPLFIPCHRVVQKNGALGGFGGGLEMKKLLLESEGVKVEKGRARPAA